MKEYNPINIETYTDLINRISKQTSPCSLDDISGCGSILFLGTSVILTQARLIGGIKELNKNASINLIAHQSVISSLGNEKEFMDRIIPWEGGFTEAMVPYICDGFKDNTPDAFVFRGIFDDLRNNNIIDIASGLRGEVNLRVFQYQSEDEIMEIADPGELRDLIAEYEGYGKRV